MDELLTVTPKGLYCQTGNFYVDPWRPVDRALITHAHADHARWGSKKYLAAASSRHALRIRMGDKADLEFQPFGKPVTIGGVRVTFYPAGHILGSAQIKIEKDGYSTVVSGDYKRTNDPTCQPFEPVRCNTFVTESTFGLPIYRWPDPQNVFDQINEWWRNNQQSGTASMLLAYSLGKAQRLLAGVDASIGPIYTHGAVHKLNAGYEASGIALPATTYVGDVDPKETDWSRALIVAPPAAAGTRWAQRFGKLSVGMASGWMQIRGTRRRRSMDRGFILSDHVDWSSLLQTIRETEAENVWVTHGYSSIVARHLETMGLNASVIETEFEGEQLIETSDSGKEDAGD
ncbi:ligase-associated DNA damage response exonuclease [Mariniblastus fucicola]|uniref:Metallo-beta-lactamase superfamily protein n=1 Tax=Mariniblastus fucicola TaxID=980251 RepID=A0A5B9PKV8_9BACT|nr:ligase-associated DNA damage response exonuclease [Mariniblastus fucicola]QEG23033.1 Metallo-beta-lactamase superfamily protein [Mariniblastus fucicola]